MVYVSLTIPKSYCLLNTYLRCVRIYQKDAGIPHGAEHQTTTVLVRKARGKATGEHETFRTLVFFCFFSISFFPLPLPTTLSFTLGNNTNRDPGVSF